MTIRVLVADDQEMIRDGLVSLLSAATDIEVVGQAGNGREAVALTGELVPDVVVMDIRMPIMDGFLLKDAPAAELLAGVRVVAAGDALLAPSITRRLIGDFARRRRHERPRPEAVAALTPRECDVLRLIARGLSNAEIAEELVLAEQTVKTHVGHMLTKLDLRDRTQAVVYAYENGFAG
jgi:DNA-binding NarL/FixJ family response regulator